MKTYFIKSGDWVKIGRSNKPAKRFLALQGACPTPLQLIKISDVEEKEAHKIARGKTNRASGEWFRLNDELESWIKSLPLCEDEQSVRNEISYACNGVGAHLREHPMKRRVKNKLGRPKSSDKKQAQNLSLTPFVTQKAKTLAKEEGKSLSSWIEALITKKLSPTQ